MLFILLFIPGDLAGSCFIGFAIGESHKHKSAATDVSCRRLDDSEGEGYRHGSIHGIAALLQNCDAGLRAEHFVRGDHGVRAACRLLRPGVQCVGVFRRVVLEFAGGLRMTLKSGEQQKKCQQKTATKNILSFS